MTTDNYIVISSDTHAGPQLEEYGPYIDPAHRPAFDEMVAQRKEFLEAYLHETSMVDAFKQASGMSDELIAGFAAHPTMQPGGAPGLRDAEFRRRDLDGQGIAGEVMFPDFTAMNDPPWGALGGGPGEQPELINAGCRAWNRWLADVVSDAPVRRAGTAVIPFYDPEAAVEEIRWAREHGLRGGVYLPGHSGGRPHYNDPMYEPIWAACEDYQMPLNVHVGNDLPMATYGAGPEAFALSQTEMLWFGHRALWFLMWAGVFERHPGLNICFAEQDCYWVPQTLRELETIFDSKFAGPGVRQRLKLRPTEIWNRQCFVGATVMSRAEVERRHEIGIDNVMWGSDYPHMESSWPYSRLVLRHTFHDVPVDEVRRMVGGTAGRVYNFDMAALAEVAARIGPSVEDLATPVPPEEIPRDYIGEGFRRPLSHTGA